MINGNRIQYGYGDVAVMAGLFGNIIIQQFKPAQECGTRVDPNAVEWIGECISVGSSYDDLVKLNSQLNAVEERKYSEFEFDGYMFDFTNYNEKSVQVCKKKVKQALSFAIMTLAC